MDGYGGAGREEGGRRREEGGRRREREREK